MAPPLICYSYTRSGVSVDSEFVGFLMPIHLLVAAIILVLCYREFAKGESDNIVALGWRFDSRIAFVRRISETVNTH